MILGEDPVRRGANMNTAMEDCCECQEGDLGGPAFNAPGRYCFDTTEFEKVGAREKSWSRPDKRDYMKADAWKVDLSNAKPKPAAPATHGLEVQVAEEICTDFAKTAEASTRLGSDGCLAQYDGWSAGEYCGQYKYSTCSHERWGEAYSACCPDYCGNYVSNYVDCWWFEQDVGRCDGPEGNLQGTQCLTANDVCCVCRYGRVANHWGKYTNSDGSLSDEWSGQEASVASAQMEGQESKVEMNKDTSLATNLASQISRLQKTNRALKEALNALTN